MIKRDGVELINARTSGVKSAKETIKATKLKYYTAPSGIIIDISSDVDQAIKGTILYKDDLPYKDYNISSTIFEVTNETTTQAAIRLAAQGKTDIVALNFASARNQGGGFLSGAIAQEEDLCRSSALYACLKSKPVFYNENILCDNAYYTDNIIYSPKVPFFKDESDIFLEKPYTLSIISAPAPNVRAIEKVDEKVLLSTLHIRAVKILQIAEAHGHKNIILGAWGCGAFGNDPKMVIKVFLDSLKSLASAFEHVCFAVYDTRPGHPLYTAFEEGIIFQK